MGALDEAIYRDALRAVLCYFPVVLPDDPAAAVRYAQQELEAIEGVVREAFALIEDGTA